MDIATLRLGFAHAALRAALGDELFPISFGQGSFAFVDRRSGASFFCTADNAALPVMRLEADGTLNMERDAECDALRARAEPAYLAQWTSFARDFDRANSSEARAERRSALAPVQNRSSAARPALAEPESASERESAAPIAAPGAPRFSRAPRKAAPAGR